MIKAAPLKFAIFDVGSIYHKINRIVGISRCPIVVDKKLIQIGLGLWRKLRPELSHRLILQNYFPTPCVASLNKNSNGLFDDLK